MRINAKKGEAIAWVKDAALFDGNECLLWPYAKNYRGYGQLTVKQKRKEAHRLVCEIVHGYPKSYIYQAAHICGNGHKGCCTPNHLRWATKKENEKDKKIHKTDNQGSRHGMAKLTEQKVIEIKKKLGIESQVKIAEYFGVCVGTINAISTGRTWTHVT